uniref:ATP synthase subunit g, mitochondrial n=2 Tax=Clytia hemisphaerica TaxID=252671 RepID=A0A7M5UXM9_9CNID
GEQSCSYNFAFWVVEVSTDKMAAKAVQGVVAQISALSPAFLVRVGSRGFNAAAKLTRVTMPKAQNFAKNASVEMAPPSPGEFMGQLNILKNDILAGKSAARASNLTVNEMAAKGFVLVEVGLWFYLGEMLGRKSIIGYNPKV